MLPKYCSISILCILFFVAPLHALQCYTCEDCLKEPVEYEDCSDSKNACIKVKIGESVSKACINDNFCSIDKFEEGLSTAWSKLKHVFTGENEAEKPRSRAFNCCYTDYCNSGNRFGNVIGTIGASLFLLSLMFFRN